MENDPHDSASASSESEAAAMEEDPVTVSLGPMGSLFRQLRSAIAWPYSRLKGVQAEIQILGEGLEGLCTDLKDLSQAEDTMTMCWVRQVRDLCYDTADYLDELMHFIHNSSGTRPRTRRPSTQNRLGSKIFRVSSRLRLSLLKVKKPQRAPLIAKLSALVARVEDADERRKRFKIAPPQASKQSSCQADSDSPLMPQLALQPHVDNLIKLLGFHHDNNERNLKVVTIFGSACVDKTAVARTLYHKYQGRFEYHAFLRVSRDPDIRRLLADMLSQIKAPPASAFSDVEGLIATITEYLQGKSYFIIIDDLWDTSTWDIIRYALPDGDSCRIITTTQIEDIALACCSDQLKHIYKITPHNDDQSGKSQDGVTTYHCTEEGMKEALNLVYNNLPPHLQTCLLYLDIYPEGWTVKKGELVKQWIAEGFIRSVEGQDAYETAGCYFDALVSRGMLQSVDTNHKAELLSCTLHHMVLDLIRQKSMQENFVTIVNYFHTIIGLPDKVRRLSVQMGGAKGANNISGNMRISQVRSLMFCGFFKSVPSIMEYGLLQVLILHIWSDQDGILDLTTIGDLYRLRYLKIDCSITVKLPEKIRRLQQLGTLQVDARLYVVPSDIVHLEKLLHLRLRSDSILPHGVGCMTRLRTLGSFDIGCNSEDNVRDLGALENLKDLQLTCPAVQPAESLERNMQLLLDSVLKKLSMLQSLTLVPTAGSSNATTLQDGAGASSMTISCDGSSSVFPVPGHLHRLELSHRCCIFSRFPNWLGDLAQLCILKIAVGKLSKEDIIILDRLPSLASLSLHVATMSKENIVFGKQGFSVLRYFKFTCTAPCLKFEAGAMPNLEKLKLCFNLLARKICIERLSGVKEISAIIGCAGVDPGSARLLAIIRNDPSNPEVQLMGSIYYGDNGKGVVTREGIGGDGYNEAVIRVADGAEEPDWRAAESALKGAIPRYPKLDSDVNIKTADCIEEVSNTNKKQLPSEQHGRIKDIKQNSATESASALPSFPHPDTKPKESIRRRRNTMDNNAFVDPRPMPLHFLMEITNGFSKDHKVGAGSYGTVYKGEQKNGETIAVKLLHEIPGLDAEQFEKEYHNLASLQHKNVVRLVGYCDETRREVVQFNGKNVFAEVTKRALCFQYMHNGGLDNYLSDEFCGHDWPRRYGIIKGICQGLKYLHEELHSPMYHLDLKPSNVLLDENMDPKLADCGLSRLFGGDKTQISTSSIGKIGYIPPEYVDAGIISNKFDVFSLGVVIVRIMTGPAGYYRSVEMSSNEFIERVQANWRKRLNTTSVYLQDSYSGQVKRCIEIALSCLEGDRHKRPSIGLIVNMLNETETLMKFPYKDIGTSAYKICHCISNETNMMDNPLNKLFSYTLDVTDNRGELHETVISTICRPEDDASTFEEPIRPKIEIIDYTEGFGLVMAIDVHPTEPWILVGHLGGYVSVWNHQTKARLMAFKEQKVRVYAVRFIARKEWIIAGDDKGQIHVYTYTTTKSKLKEFQAHGSWVRSLAVHPTDPFVLSSSEDKLIKLWNWENGWECIRTFQSHSSSVMSVKFSPLTTASNTFASASRDGTVKIWSMLSDTPITTLKITEHVFFGTHGLTSVDYFVVHGNHEYIVTGSGDGTAQIWNLETKTCIQHIEGLQQKSGCVAVLDCLPGHPILVTISHDQIVSFCNSTTHRYQNTVDFKFGDIEHLAYIKDTRSLVVAGYNGIAIMEIS